MSDLSELTNDELEDKIEGHENEVDCNIDEIDQIDSEILSCETRMRSLSVDKYNEEAVMKKLRERHKRSESKLKRAEDKLKKYQDLLKQRS